MRWPQWCRKDVGRREWRKVKQANIRDAVNSGLKLVTNSRTALQGIIKGLVMLSTFIRNMR
jgi:hypothetical protein